MSKILIDEDTVKLALEALQYIDLTDNDRDFLHPHECYMIDEAITALREAQAEQPEQQEPVAKMGMYEHKCPNVTGHRGPSFVCQKAGHGVGQNSYCKGCICPEALNTSQPAPVQQGWPSDCLVSEKAKQSGFDLSPMPNLLYTVRGNHAQLVNFARAMLAAAPQPAQQEPVAKDDSNYRLDPPGLDPLYTSLQAQRTWVGLTHEEHMEIMMGTMTTSSRMAAVEAKLREKNT